MPGGLLQLAAVGSQNIFLNGNPSLTYFKKVIKTHTNFSMESIRLYFNRSSINLTDTTFLKCKIDRHGDLLSNLYFVVEMPELRNQPGFDIRWVNYLGLAMIESASIFVGGAVMSKLWSETMFINSELEMNDERKRIFYKMIGNVPEMNQNSPPIKPRMKLYIPLNFWFVDAGLALPMLSMQYHDTELQLNIRALKDLYKVNDLKPQTENVNHHLKNFAYNVTQYQLTSGTLDIKCYLEASYIFLEDVERKFFSSRPLDYLIEQTVRIDKLRLSENNVVGLTLQNPVKHLIFLARRSDFADNNEWFDFVDDGGNIIKTAKIMFNGVDRIEEKDFEYYNLVQCYQHYQGCLPNGVGIYSFSLYPNQFNPSGQCNMSRIPNIQMAMNLRKPNDPAYHYDISIFSVNYNFFRVMSGLASVAFAS
jgi:hypothetical protein